MKFMLLCYDDEQYWEQAGADAHRVALDEALRLTHELYARGQYELAAPLHRSSSASCVRSREGTVIVTDGPFAERREVLGGFYLVDVETAEEALEIAAQHPGARVGCVEVRPVLELPNLPGT